MNTEITATHENGNVIKIVRNPANVERTVKHMEQCGYVYFTFKTTTGESKSGY